jgi:two-component system, LytTR family, response regulator
VHLITLVVGTEKLELEELTRLLVADPDVAVVRAVRDGGEALAAIRAVRPDVMFLDVQRLDVDGVELVREIGAGSLPAVVFVAAEDQRALEVLAATAFDYLTKPFTASGLAQAMAGVKTGLRQRSPEESNRQILRLLWELAEPHRYVEQLAVRVDGKTIVVKVTEVDWIEAAENQVKLHIGPTGHPVHLSIVALERSLDPALFVRVHPAAMVNISRIKQMRPTANGEYAITLTTGVRLRTARVYWERLAAIAAGLA